MENDDLVYNSEMTGKGELVSEIKFAGKGKCVRIEHSLVTYPYIL